MKNTISQERLVLIYESALRQFRSGATKSKVIIKLYSKGLEEDEAETLANKAYAEYQEEKRQEELKESYDKPLISFPIKFFKTIFRGLGAWVLSIFTGHLISPGHLKKHDEERVE